MNRLLIVEADGGSRGNPGPAGYGAVVRDAATGQVLAERSGFIGRATNNVAEYRGLIAGIEAAVSLDPFAELDIRLDSKLLVCQMDGSWQVKSPELKPLVAAARAAIGGSQARFTWVPREHNMAADALANRAMDEHVGYQPDFEGLGGLPGSPKALEVAQAVRQSQMAPSGAQRYAGLPDEPTTVILVRHGITALTVQEAFAGSNLPGHDLSAEGGRQAAGAALELRTMLDVPWAYLRPPVALLASPTARTMQTAAELALVLGLEVTPTASWTEQDFGEWDGLTKDQASQRWPGEVERWFSDQDYSPPGGESRTAVGRRVRAALRQLTADHRGQCVAVVSHTMAIRAAIGAAIGAPPSVWFGFRINPASISIVRLWDQAHSELICLNRTVARL